MRREIFRIPDEEARALLLEAPHLHLAAVSPAGQPILRALNFAPLDDDLCFHGAPAGEKLEVLGGRCVLSAVDEVALLPSTFSDAERACPASNLYRSAQAHGVLERIEDPHTKARALQSLMERFQPDGGHVPIDPAHARYPELYQREVAGVLVVRVRLERVDGKAKLAQNRTPADRARLLDKLWRRGEPGDARALELVARANRMSVEDKPAAFRGPAGVTLHCWLEHRRVEELAALHGASREDAKRSLAQAHLRAAAWVGALDEHDALVGSVRAVGDTVQRAMICDFAVAPAWRAQGLEAALLALVRDHPAVRGCAEVEVVSPNR